MIESYSSDREATGEAATNKTPASVPAGIAFLIEERPLIWSENPAEYDALRASVFDDMAPDGAIEQIMAKHYTDAIWELRRMRRLSNASVNVEVSWYVTLNFTPVGEYDEEEWTSRMAKISRAAVFGENEPLRPGEHSLKKHCEVRHAPPDMLNYEAYKREAATMEALSRQCERLERRINRLLKDFDARRASLGVMARTLLTREATTSNAPRTN